MPKQYVLIKTRIVFENVYAVEVNKGQKIDYIDKIAEGEFEEISQCEISNDIMSLESVDKETVIAEAKNFWYNTWKDEDILSRLVNRVEVTETPSSSDKDRKWVCPIKHPGCIENCGNYGCGN